MVEQDDLSITEKLTPESLNHEILPDQTMYEVDLENSKSFDLDTVNSHPAIFTDDIKLYVIDGEPGEIIDWHTHMPHIDQILIGISGRAKYVLDKGDENHQELVLDEGKAIYLPGGARHRMEVIGDEHHKEFCIYPSVEVARVEMLEEDWGGYDMESWPIALWIDKMTDKVIAKDDEVVQE